MLVVVLVVSRMPASVVHVVDVIPVWDRDMATALTVDMAMVLVHRVAGCFTFVVVILVPSMKVTVVRVVDVIAGVGSRRGRILRRARDHVGRARGGLR